MKQVYISIVFVFVTITANAQQWFATRMADMPEPVSNNAVVEGWANDTGYVYSFGGIDSTKLWSGIHLKSFRYNTVTDVWDTIPSLPDTLGKIAAGASWVDSIVYIIGGYHVYSNGNESSSDRVHRYDPRTNTYLPDGAPVPVPIDDHVQAVWNDSLIYVITGWSNTGNVPDVQIYDPANDQWLTGTPVPNNNTYKAFGASGTIAGNTIYYHGGAAYGFNFPGQSTSREGHINPNNPTQITWFDSPSSYVTYRAACTYVSRYYPFLMYPTVNWLGGSEVTYNYNGIAYNGSGGVNPRTGCLWNMGGGSPNYEPTLGEPLPMDLRGIAGSFMDIQGELYYYIAGGMDSNQVVSDKTLKLHYTSLFSGVNENVSTNYKLFPNPTSFQINLIFEKQENRTVRLLDVLGKEVFTTNTNELLEQIDVSSHPKGIYFIKVETDIGSQTQKIIIQ